MIPRAIIVGATLIMSQSAEHKKIILNARQRLENVRQLESESLRARCPVGKMHTVGNENESHPSWLARGNRFAGTRELGRDRIE